MSDDKQWADTVKRIVDRSVIHSTGHAVHPPLGAAVLKEFVEARETKLGARLTETVRQLVRDAFVAWRDGRRTLAIDEMVDDAISRAAYVAQAEAVSGDVACGLAFDNGRMQAQVTGRWAVAVDALIDNENMDAGTTLTLLYNLGLKPLCDYTHGLTDEELLKEVARRGLASGIVAAGAAAAQRAETASVRRDQCAVQACALRPVQGARLCQQHVLAALRDGHHIAELLGDER